MTARGRSGHTLLDGLRTWAGRTPDHVALTDGDVVLTFSEVLRLVEATSGAARTALEPASPAAYLPVLVDRSANSAVAVLACLLGDVPFFPVDAHASAALKRSLMLRAGDPGCYLVGAKTADGITDGAAVEVTAIGDASVSPAPAGSGQPTMVIFSSGSTGDPKGIVLPHEAIAMRWRAREDLALALGDDRRQPLVSSFDSSWGIQLLADIASGFSGYAVDLARIGLPSFLAEMAQFRATAMSLPVQAARLLAQLPDHSLTRLPTMRRVNLGAEGVRFEYLDGLRRILEPDAEVIHNLASSEGGREIGITFRIQDAPAQGVVPVGDILFPEDLRLVDAEGHEADVMEVHVSGAIASEYLDDPNRTAERFYTDPDGRRWWRSGDLVTQGPDGLFHHVSRSDDVVKVGGRLAAPGDVTAVLLAVDGIHAAITVPVVIDGNTRLVAHVEVTDGADVTLATVREALSSRLQPYAVPAAVLRHHRLPVNARGKIDRQTLADGPFEPW